MCVFIISCSLFSLNSCLALFPFLHLFLLLLLRPQPLEGIVEILAIDDAESLGGEGRLQIIGGVVEVVVGL